MKKRIAVLVSGGGTNLQALIDAEAAGQIPHGEITLVVSNKEDLENGLKKAFLNREYRLEKTKKGLEVASQYHDTQLVSEKILEIFESIN